MSDPPRIVRVVVSGRVQGVGYRMWTARRASVLRLEGWVRNRKGGEVEAVLSGAPEAVAEMLATCWEGPPMAVVVSVAVEEAGAEALAPLGTQSGFVVLPSA